MGPCLFKSPWSPGRGHRRSLNPVAGFALTEILFVLLLFGIGMTLFHTIFVTNWMAYQRRIAVADLWQDANEIIERMSIEGRQASQYRIDPEDDSLAVSFLDENSEAFAVYTMTREGTMTLTQPGFTETVLSDNIEFLGSNLTKQGRSLKIALTLREEVFDRTVQVTAQSEIFPRN